MSSRFSCNSEAFVSELLEKPEEMFLPVVKVNPEPYNSGHKMYLSFCPPSFVDELFITRRDIYNFRIKLIRFVTIFRVTVVTR